MGGAADLSTANLARVAVAATNQSWDKLGLDCDAAGTTTTVDTAAAALQLRATAIIMMRLAAITAPPNAYANLATGTIGKTILADFMEETPTNASSLSGTGESSLSSLPFASGGKSAVDNNNNNKKQKKYTWPGMVNGQVVVQQVHNFVGRMFQGYKQVPYHNQEHAFHVLQSITKLIDLMITGGGKTYGLKYDPLALFALVFAALIHDVEHQGIPNRQLAIEDDRLAVLYNDQSMAENWSLYVGFSELLQDEFKAFRNVLVPQEEEYRRFRRMVITMVLTTDIASPERTQVGKSKWKEAFGDPFETVERKMRETARMQRRGSAISALSGVSSRITEDNIDGAEGHNNGREKDDDDSYSITPENSVHGGDSQESDSHDNNVMMNNSGPGRLYKDLYSNPPGDRQKFERRMSATSTSSRFRQRLGILRTVDLSGETLETYQRRGSLATAASIASTVGGAYSVGAVNQASIPTTAGYVLSSCMLDDEPDELKVSVVMDTLLTAADVAHNLQGWELMIKWSNRLYLELRRAYVAQRGIDPQEKWFENQIGFLESYLLPLARRMEDMGVFSDDVAQMFSATVESNRDRWLREGFDEAKAAIAKGKELYPK